MKALLVDDERLARRELARLLAAHPRIEVAGECASADEAETAIARLRPELIFLDVQMPGRSGFELLESLDAVPAVIFTTAFDEFALRAFEVSAVDYLVKPIVPARLAAAIAKLAARAPAQAPLDAERQIFVRDGERCWFVRLRDVLLFASEGNYTRLHFAPARATGPGDHALVLRSLDALEARLDPEVFFRASRQHIVNTAAIERLDPWPNGGLRARLRGGLDVPISRRQALRFQARMRL
ncbi:MAG: LytR/AlgR family response regulator transcription factor [Terriglobales bacterium]